jgi:hypothetical protein
VLAGTSIAGLCLIAVLVAPILVRRRIASRARAAGLSVDYRSLALHWDRLELSDVRVAAEGVEAVASVGVLEARWSFAGMGDVRLRDVKAASPVSLEQLRQQLERWRSAHRHDSSTPASSSQRAVNVDGLAFQVGGRPAKPEFVGSVRSLALDHGELSVSGASLEVDSARYHLALDDLATRCELAPLRCRSVQASKALVRLDLAAPANEAPPPDASAAPAAPTAATDDALWQRAEAIRSRFTHALEVAPVGAELSVASITVVDAATESSFGPWTLHFASSVDAVAIELTPTTESQPKPLSLRAHVPRDAGRWTAELALGPQTIGSLGIKEGAYGLRDVDRSSVTFRGAIELDPAARSVAADGALQLHDFAIANAKVSEEPIEGVDLAVRGVLTASHSLADWSLTGGALEIGKLKLTLDGSYESSDGSPRFAATWAIPSTDCGEALASAPKALVPLLDGLQMQGTFAANGSVAIRGALSSPQPVVEVELSVDQRCRTVRAPAAIAASRFREPFAHRIYDPTGKPKTATFGPTTPGWVPYDRISPYVVDALLTCEDAGFFTHNGFSALAIRNAIIRNLKERRFAVGASTLSMQLAKNLYLDRRKLLSRKIQEAVLTTYLEQSFTKNELLELYLNVVELGPDLYGIGPAALHWFGRPAAELDPAEAMFLVSLLPSPVKRHSMFAAGAPSDGYLKYVRSLLAEAHKRGHLDDDEYQAALENPLTFHKPGTPLPPPRAAGGHLRLGTPGDEPTDEGPPLATSWAPIP